MTQKIGVSRRGFLGAGLAAAAAVVANAATAAPRATEVDSWDEEFDMVVVGSGFAGLSACYEAQRLGLKKIVVLEKMEAYGGNSALCGGLAEHENAEIHRTVAARRCLDDGVQGRSRTACQRHVQGRPRLQSS